MTWIGPQQNFGEVTRLLPVVSDKYEALYASLWQQDHIPPATLELCRLRLAQLHRFDGEHIESAESVPAAKQDALSNWPTDAAFSDAERACLSFAEVYAADTQAITDEQAATVTDHHGETGLIVLIEALGIFDGRIRMAQLWQLPDSAEE